jgi:hypothetical protein
MRVAARPAIAYGLLFGTVAALLGSIASLSGVANETVAIDRLWLGLGALVVCTGVALVWLVLPIAPPRSIDRRLAVAPAAILGIAFSFFANGFGSLLTHQAAWGLIGACGVMLVVSRPGHRMFPPWLIAFAVLVPILELASGAETGAVYDTGIGAIVLFTAWHVTAGFGEEGGVTRFLGCVACIYWGVTFVGLVVGFTHISLGSMNPASVELPWAGGLGGNKLGYGIVASQVGRMLTMVVCAYHLVMYRTTTRKRFLNGSLAMIAGAIFLFQYGRIPLVGGIVIVTLVLATGRNGTNIRVLALILVVAVLAIFGGGSFSLRIGTKGWDSGHAAIWSQQITLFSFDPLAGVSGHPTEAQLSRAQSAPVLPALQNYDSLDVYGERLTTALQQKGSRGEGGWTGALAQRGAIGTGIVIALMIAAGMSVVRPLRNPSSEALRDAILLRSILPATILWYVTDLQPAGFTTFGDYVILQLTMFAAVSTIRRRYNSLRSTRPTGRPVAFDAIPEPWQGTPTA